MRVTAVSGVKECEQLAPQLIPVGVLVTVPVPVPFFVTVKVTGVAVKVAVTEVVAPTVTAQVPVPEQPPPLQPEKTDPLPALEVNVMGVPLTTVSAQSTPQLMAFVGVVLVTVPAPDPALTTLSVTDVGAAAVPQASLLKLESPAAL